LIVGDSCFNLSSKENCLVIDGLPVINPGSTGDWHSAAKAQVFQLMSRFSLNMAGEVLFVKTLMSKDGRSKLEVGLNSASVARAIRRAFFSYVRPNSPLMRPDWLNGIQINPAYTAGTRVRVLILKVILVDFSVRIAVFFLQLVEFV